MGQYLIRRLLVSIPTLLVISLVVFTILELSPADPVGNLPLTIPPAVREQIRDAMGVNDPFLVKFAKWLRQFMINEPLNIIEETTGLNFAPRLSLAPDDLIARGEEGFDSLASELVGEVESAARSVLVDGQARELFRSERQFFLLDDNSAPLFLNETANGTVGRELSSDNVDVRDGEILPLHESRLRYLSWQTRSPIIDLVIERTPQTLWVVGLSYLAAIFVAVPIGVIQAYRQYSNFDRFSTVFATIGFSVPTFFIGLLFIYIFSVQLGWFPSIYDTTHVVTDLDSFLFQLRQSIMPVTVLALFYMALLSRHTRSSMLENLKLDYVRTARSKGIAERRVVGHHALRNSLIPVVTLIALGIPGVFQGAIITEQIFRVNGLGQLLIIAIQGGDLPTVQTLTFIFAVLNVFFNIVADVLYAVLDPRIRYT
ncbi:MAG: ABC transporter permease [Anaerolineaceae bacterium]|nr:ABC transporter permease [Anaerolineaceae bacterium]